MLIAKNEGGDVSSSSLKKEGKRERQEGRKGNWLISRSNIWEQGRSRGACRNIYISEKKRKNHKKGGIARSTTELQKRGGEDSTPNH